MNIIIAGCGKIGSVLAKDLSAEERVNVTIIDVKPEALEKIAESVDAMFIEGTALNTTNLLEAGAKEADLIISVTNADETNILCCILAKRLGTRHTIARVRNPEFALDTNMVWKDLGLDLVINPENETAREISRLLRFPTADDIDAFLGGRVEIVSFKASEAHDFFVGKSVMDIFYKKKLDILLAAVERDNQAIIPKGDFVFQDGDIIRIMGRPVNIMSFFVLLGKNVERIKSVAIVGGSKITYYLVDLLQRHSSGTTIKIVELSKEKCENLSEKFPRCLIINGDGSDETILASELIGQTEAIVCLTDRDEENAVISLYSRSQNFRKVITKIDHINPKLVKHLGLGSVVSPKNLTSERMIRYVRALSHASASGDNVNSVFNLFSNDEDRVEAIEFVVGKESKCLNKPLKSLKIKKGVLVGCIVRGASIIMPTGDTEITTGDVVIIVAKNESLTELDDILTSLTESFFGMKRE